MTFDVILKNAKGKWVAAYIDKLAANCIRQAEFWMKEAKELNNGHKVHFKIH